MSPVCILQVRMLAMVLEYLLSLKYYLSLVEGQSEKCSSCIFLRSVQLHQYAALWAACSVAQNDNSAHLYGKHINIYQALQG